ncbi:MAG: hypothetical protein DRI57_32075 [Deltaproteobacteria bacterium]|nr:MAG: hypothetical protein DRI57_32075 [Deltaproteobacteria bacterium]
MVIPCVAEFHQISRGGHQGKLKYPRPIMHPESFSRSPTAAFWELFIKCRQVFVKHCCLTWDDRFFLKHQAFQVKNLENE